MNFSPRKLRTSMRVPPSVMAQLMGKCAHRPDFHLNVVVLSLFQYLAGHQSAPYMTFVGSKPEE